MDNYLAYALELHRKYPVVDAHLDLAAEIYWRNQNKENHVIEQRYLPKLQKNNINLIVSSIFIESEFLPENGMDMTFRQIDALRTDIEKSNGEVIFIQSKQDLEYSLEHHIPGIMLYCEGLDQIGSDVEKLNKLYNLGVRGASLTWSRKNDLGTGSCRGALHEDIHGGLTEVGKAVINRIEELGMFLDVSHLNDDGLTDCLQLVKKSVMATHSNSRSICNSYRNLTDDQIATLAKQGGVIGLNNCVFFTGGPSLSHEQYISVMVDHIEHILHIAGEKYSGFGFDFCDSYAKAYVRAHDQPDFPVSDSLSENYNQVPELTAEILRRGYSEGTAALIMGGNFLSYFEKMLP